MINLELNENIKGQDYIVGDIHGAFSKLRLTLMEIGFKPEVDRLICCGDLVDRGPESDECLTWLDQPWFFSVSGNHEQMLIDAYRTNDYELHYCNGGAWFVSLSLDEQAQYVDVLCDLPLTITIKSNNELYGIIHAEVTSDDWLVTKQYLSERYKPAVERALWARTKISKADNTCIAGLNLLFVGHTIVDEPVSLGNVIYLDTCGWHDNGHFSIFNLTRKTLM